MNLPSYVLITPARNEAQFLESTIRSVVSQSVRPVKWVIVSDGSTDGTDDIVTRYAAEHSWIELVRLPERRERHFAGKVLAFNAAYARVGDLQYDVIGSLDADITFDEEYFAFLLAKLAADPTLGVVGTPFKDDSVAAYDYRLVGIEHVSGACQVFRRACFEQIGGYTPIKGGGIDFVAVISARMKGWNTRTFTEKVCFHHRSMGTAQHGNWTARFKTGTKDYVLGSHPLWQVLRGSYQILRKPYLLGGLLLLSGYFWAAVSRRERAVSGELMAFRRREQMDRLRRLFTRRRPETGGFTAPQTDRVQPL